MRLFLMQHGLAVPDRENPQRPLSQAGEAEVARMGRFLAATDAAVEEIWHSGKLRSRQTAEIIAGFLAPRPVLRLQAALAPDADPAGVLTLLAGRDKLLLVGHLPQLSRLVPALLGMAGAGPVVRFQPGGMVCLESEAEGGWEVAWFVTPGLLTA